MMRRRASRACRAASRSNVSSVLPSSTTMISYGRANAVSVSVNSRYRSSTLGDSFLTGMTTDSSGALRNLLLIVLPVRQEEDLGAFLRDYVAAVAKVARRDEPPDDLAL